jgi:hypothetical protein
MPIIYQFLFIKFIEVIYIYIYIENAFDYSYDFVLHCTQLNIGLLFISFL